MKIIEVLDPILSVYPKSCIGCNQHDRYIMIAVVNKGNDQIIDLFLDKAQSELLYEQMKTIIDYNTKLENKND